MATQSTHQSNGLVLHKLQRENLRAEVLTTDGEPKKILAALMSRPDASGNWLTFELRPNRSGHASLLDLPPPCSVKATRFSEDGSTAQFQLLANVRFEDLAQFLDFQGWRIQPGSRYGESFRCEKAGREFELTRLTNDSVLLRVCS